MRIYAKFTKMFEMEMGFFGEEDGLEPEYPDLTVGKEYLLHGVEVGHTYVINDHEKKHYFDFDNEDDGFVAADHFTLRIETGK